jgi:hypothetical protein
MQYSPPVQDYLAAIGWGWISISAICFGLAVKLPKSAKTRIALGSIVGAIALAPMLLVIDGVRSQHRGAEDYKTRLAGPEALFAEKCKTAGVKVYKTVGNVQGLFLNKLRAPIDSTSSSDANWPDAALPLEHRGEWYIVSFLGWEQRQGDGSWQGPVNVVPTPFPGYLYVDVPTESGLVSRYTLTEAEPKQWKLTSSPATGSPARYAVDFSNPADPNARASWIAETVITIRDRETNELLAERRSFAFDRGLGSQAGGRQPWAFAVTCPKFEGGAPTRAFVEQVLGKSQRK